MAIVNCVCWYVHTTQLCRGFFKINPNAACKHNKTCNTGLVVKLIALPTLFYKSLLQLPKTGHNFVNCQKVKNSSNNGGFLYFLKNVSFPLGNALKNQNIHNDQLLQLLLCSKVYSLWLAGCALF